MVDDMLARIAALLHKAEVTESPDEQEAYFAKAQVLASKYEIDLSMARAHTAKDHNKKATAPIVRRIEIGVPGDRGAGAYTDLFSVIGEINDVRCIMANSWVEAFGMESDVDMTETLYGAIIVQMVHACSEYISTGEYREDGVSVHDARRSFYQAYRQRIGERLRMAKNEAMDEARNQYRDDSIGMDLVLRDKKREVDGLYWQSAWRLPRRRFSSGTSRSAKRAGRHAANTARMGNAGSLGGKREIT